MLGMWILISSEFSIKNIYVHMLVRVLSKCYNILFPHQYHINMFANTKIIISFQMLIHFVFSQCNALQLTYHYIVSMILWR